MKRDKHNPTIEGLGGIQAKVIEHQLHPSQAGKPLITIQLRYPRFIHAELMTHRVFSRNASQSRAIPVKKVLEQVRNEPAMPVHWGKNQAGMQAQVEGDSLVAFYPMLSNDTDRMGLPGTFSVQEAWREAAIRAADIAEAMSKAGYHKQVVNRILEPFQFISVIVTSTEWDNFFELRDHPDAQPEIHELANVMKQAIAVSKQKQLDFGQWHLPYVSSAERAYYNTESCRKLSAARCARVSYLTHDGKDPKPEDDFALFDRLVGSRPLHASPIEHQATPDYYDTPDAPAEWGNRPLWGNLQTWVQHRKVHERSLLH